MSVPGMGMTRGSGYVQGAGISREGVGISGGMTYPMMHVMLPPSYEQTDACENITFPQIYTLCVQCSVWQSVRNRWIYSVEPQPVHFNREKSCQKTCQIRIYVELVSLSNWHTHHPSPIHFRLKGAINSSAFSTVVTVNLSKLYSL